MRRRLRKFAVKIVALSIVGVIVVFAIFHMSQKSEAAWFDDSYQYRQRITVTVPSNASLISNLDTQIVINTSTLISAGKLQSSCQDLRFTNILGKKLIYYIDSGCNTTTTKVWVRVDTVPANTTTYNLYMYYGNSTAAAGSDANTMWRVKGLVTYWTMNDGVGTSAADSSFNGDNLTLGSGNSAPSWVSGKYSNGLSFGGTNSYATLGSGATAGLYSSDGSISFWYKGTQDTDGNVFTKANASFTQDWDIELGQNAAPDCATPLVTVFAYVSGTMTQEICAQSSNRSLLFDNNWHHVVVTDGASTSIYIDGTKMNSAAAGTTSDTALFLSNASANAFQIGRLDNTTNYLNGQLDDFRIYNRELSANEVSSLYADPGTIASSTTTNSEPTTSFASEEKTPSPIGYWKLDEGVGSTVYNSGIAGSSLNANLGTGNSAPTWMPDDECVSGKCMQFNGAVNYVSTGLATTQATQISGEAWVKWYGTTSATQMVFYNGDSNSNGYGIIIADGNCASGSEINILIGGRWCDGSFSTTNLSKNVWTHIAFTNDGTYWNLYVNGKFQSRNSTWTANTPSGAFYIGGKGSTVASGSTAFNGLIDDVKFYNYTRTAAQIKADYNSKAVALSKGSATNLSTNAKDGDFLSNGLVGYWKLDEGTGTTAVDNSGNGNTGTLGSGTSAPTWTSSSKFGSALSFDGSLDYVNIPDNDAFSLNTTNQFTVSSWINPSSTTGTKSLISKGSSSNYEWEVRQAGTGLEFHIFNSGGGDIITAVTDTTALVSGTWYHYVATVDLNKPEIRVYLNGKQEGSYTSALTGTYTNGTAAFRLGIRADNANPFGGTLDEVRLYNRVLSPVEVAQLYNWAPGPSGYWPLDEGSGTTTYDKSGLGNNGTLNNGPTWTSGKYGKAVSFDGVNDNIGFGNVLNTQAAGSFTWETWIYRTSVSSDGIIISKKTSGSASSIGYYLYQYSTANGGDTCFFVADGTNQYSTCTTANATTTLNQWVHVAVVFDRSKGTSGSTIYLNGINAEDPLSESGNPTTMGSISDTPGLCFGSQSTIGACTNSIQFAGKIDDVRFYNYARTQKQINEDMTGGHPAVNSQGNGPMGYWKFNEGVGVSAYNSVNLGSGSSAYNGTLTNMSVGSTASGWVNTGKFGKALAFDGSNDYVQINGLMGTPTSITLSAWAKLNSANTNGAELISIGDYVAIRLDESGNSTAGIYYQGASSWSELYTGKNYAGTGWHHFVFVVDSNALKTYFYVDGKLLASGTMSAGITYSSQGSNTFIGQHGNGSTGYNFNGLIDEVKIYPYALTAADVKQDYAGTSGTVMGAVSTASDGKTADYSADRENCVPGDTSTCSAPFLQYKFEEGSGSTVYNSSNTTGLGTTGTWNGTGSPHFVSGKIGKAAGFNGSSDYVNLGTGVSINNSAFTVSAWIYPTNVTVSNYIIPIFVKGQWGGDANGDVRFGIDASATCSNQTGAGGISLAVFTSAGDVCIVDPTNLTPNQWTYVTGVWDGSNLMVYRNGILGTSGAQTGTLASNAHSTYIGAYPNNVASNDFKGKIDQVRVYNYARSASQIAWDYNKGGPVAWYKLNECQGTTINDSSGNGNKATLNVGGSGSQTTAGLCNDGSTASAWYNGANGKFGSSIKLDGTDDYIGIGSTNGLKSADGSVSLWFKGTDSVSDQNIFAASDASGNNALSIELGNSTGSCTNELLTVFAVVGGTTTEQLCFISTNTNILFDGNWHHIVVTDGTTTKLYIDSVQRTLTLPGGWSDTALFTSNSNITTYEIGRFGPLNINYLKGQLDDFRIYNYELNSYQIKNIMNEGSAIRFGSSTGSPP